MFFHVELVQHRSHFHPFGRDVLDVRQQIRIGADGFDEVLLVQPVDLGYFHGEHRGRPQGSLDDKGDFAEVRTVFQVANLWVLKRSLFGAEIYQKKKKIENHKSYLFT